MTDSAHSGAYYAQTHSLQAQNYAQADFCLSAGRVNVRHMKVDMTIEQKIRAIMKLTGWKQQKVAEAFEVSQSTVNRWLSGSEPEGPRRDAINDFYNEVVEREQIPNDGPVSDANEIRALLNRIEGLKPENVTALLSAIQGFRLANAALSSQALPDDQSEPATAHRGYSPSR